MSDILIERTDNKNMKDARLYITQYSRLEELLDATTNATLQAMFGDKPPKKNAIRETIKILSFTKEIEEEECYRNSENTDQEIDKGNKILDALTSKYMKFISEYEEYMTAYCKDVCWFIIENHDTINKLINDTDENLRELESVKKRYMNQDQDFVRREYKTQILTLREHFEANLKKIKDKKFSLQHDRLNISNSCKQLQNSILDLYNKVDNKELLKVKYCYERDFYQVEKKICKLFENQVQHWHNSLLD